MTSTVTEVSPAPYGSWSSPITAEDIAASGHPVETGRFVGEQVWWAEVRPTEGGRTAIRRRGGDGTPVDVLPRPWSARTRVHEYGGGAWTATGAGELVFAEYRDQRLYLLPGSTPRHLTPRHLTPRPLTPEPAVASGLRYADLTIIGDEVWCVRETHGPDGLLTRDLCAVPLDGSAVKNPAAVRSIVAGSDFLAYPRLSPNGTRLAWIAWNHPQMPWDGTELRVAEIDRDGRCGSWRTLLGGTAESVLQPEWLSDDELYAISDSTGWWNLYRVTVDAGRESVCTVDADFGAPLWQLGPRWYARLADGTLLTTRTLGTDTLSVLDPAAGTLDDRDLGDLTTVSIVDVRDSAAGTQVLLRCGGARSPSGLRLLDLSSGDMDVVRLTVDSLPDPAYLPTARPMTFTGPEREVHAITYPPRNPHYRGVDGELPPYVAFVHGGPTAHVAPALNLVCAYFTSRGIGVIEVNYGGSSGFGREYRNRLRGQWGIVDVEDVVAAVRGLAESGLADPARLAIQGGSAGGWTVLAALTTSDVFACGVSYYGVAELVRFVAETHDFESRYLDGLVGPLPEAADLYARRAPVNNVDGLSCPVLLLQGLADPIVPPSQAERFRDALVKKGIPHAYLAYPGESHGFRKVETQISAHQAELSFYGQVMGFETPGIPPLQLWHP